MLLMLAAAANALPRAMLEPLNSDDPDERSAAVAAIAASGDPLAGKVLEALAADRLHEVEQRFVFVDGAGRAFSAEDGTPAPLPQNESIVANNRLRAEIDAALAVLRLGDPDPAVQRDAARMLAASAEPEQRPAIAAALSAARSAEVSALLEAALARLDLGDEQAERRLAAAQLLAGSSDPGIRNLVDARLDEEQDEAVKQALRDARAAIDGRLSRAELVATVLTGISLGSVLLLAALGLAITYGVMGVINMAHGELLMIGAYSTFITQSVFRRWLPAYEDWYLLTAIPVAFAAAALVGLVIERLVIRHLYGRPLETLLATFGVSLILSQAARTLFGAQNVEVANPSWLSGGLALTPTLVLPLNRIGIVVFALLVLAAIAWLMVRTRIGLNVRAVTQNRRMASCIGVPSGRTDATAFALGAGIAGLGGVALSQFTNVGPDMGQSYIVDSFMVVVLGGVGQLAGTVIAAFGLGIVSKFIEGWSGAVIAKILVLVFIIVFIQRRPQGLFALKGRQADA
ncbi:MAG: urea ABC transporter permease subunit UrtB [Burkholderiaceae bacterium]